MIRNKYIYDFWKRVFYFAISALSNNNWTHHSSKLNLFQQIRLNLLSFLEAFFIKCV